MESCHHLSHHHNIQTNVFSQTRQPTLPLPLGWTQRQHIGKWHLDQHSEALQSVKCVKTQIAVAAKPLPLELCRMDRQWCFIKGISNSNTAIFGYLCYISGGNGNSLMLVNSEQGSLEWLFIILAFLDCRISKILQKKHYGTRVLVTWEVAKLESRFLQEDSCKTSMSHLLANSILSGVAACPLKP